MQDKGIIFVLDGNDGPCIRSLFAAVAKRGWKIVVFRPYPVTCFFGGRDESLGDLFRWRKDVDGVWQCFLPTLGYGRFRDLSFVVLRKAWKIAVKRFGNPSVAVYTLPQYEGMIDLCDTCKVYFAYDAYRFYAGWNELNIERLEDVMLSSVDVVCAVSMQMVEDWEMKAKGKLEHFPNAAADFLFENQALKIDRFNDIPKPIVGCVGNINASYDWELVKALAMRFSDVSFVFIGKQVDDSARIAGVCELSNVFFPGCVSKEDVRACLDTFDVCFNPLAVDNFNNRRCPLRLYDYLSTSKPVLSTAIREAYELEAFVKIGQNVNECSALLAEMLEAGYSVDLDARRQFMIGQTWGCRAKQFEDIVREKRGN
ncbi:MAG: glycosyltransferase [Kiritimatiellae bacterium]|nr:glycosyltransferase [Kiritimatiellia bacterium]